VTEPLLEASALAKAFPLDSNAKARLASFARILFGRPIAAWPVLQNINLAVQRGESLGIIGENGAGKSTLLKTLTGVLSPSAGTVRRNGSIGALLELGAGFDPELTGRQNIRTAAALMGWSATQITQRFDEIVAFADIGRYLDEPVKHYSSGMVVRLGFAIVAAVKPDLLITDEVLAVGDESFQKKCIRWMEDYLKGGGTLLLVSHSMYHVQKLCKRALWLKDGKAEAYGDVFDVTQDYLAYHERKSMREVGPDINRDYSGADFRVVRVRLNGSEDIAPRVLEQGEGIDLEVELFAPDGRQPQLGVGLLRADGTPVYGTTTEIDAASGLRIDDQHWGYRVRFEAPPLLPGGYALKLHALDPEGVRLFDTVDRGFVVRGASREFGLVRLPHRWGAE